MQIARKKTTEHYFKRKNQEHISNVVPFCAVRCVSVAPPPLVSFGLPSSSSSSACETQTRNPFKQKTAHDNTLSSLSSSKSAIFYSFTKIKTIRALIVSKEGDTVLEVLLVETYCQSFVFQSPLLEVATSRPFQWNYFLFHVPSHCSSQNLGATS